MTARFAIAPIGAGLAALDGGVTLTTTVGVANLARTARSDIARSTGTVGAEFTFWGDAALLAAIGLVQPGASLAAMVGGDAAGIGWRLDTGAVYVGNTLVASGLPVVAKGEIPGVRANLDTDTIEFYLGGVLVHSRALPVSGASWHFAASLGSAVAGELACAVNSGQWQAAGPAALAGWDASPPAALRIRLADLDWISEAHDRFEGVIDATGLETFAEIAFWPWAGQAATQGGSAQLTVLDPDDVLPAGTDLGGTPVAVLQVDATGPGIHTNLLKRSAEFNVTPWGNGGTVVANQALAPDGTMTADSFTGGVASLLQGYVPTPGKTYTFSIYGKPAVGNVVSFRASGFRSPSFDHVVSFNVATGAVTLTQPIPGSNTYTVLDADGWYRLVTTFPCNGTRADAYVAMENAPSTVYVWGAQLEEGLVTTYIPTTTAPVTVYGGNTLLGADALARHVVDHVEVVDDVRKVLHLRDAHDDLDLPLNRGVFLPSIPALAWRPRPVVIGAVASIPALLANSDGSVGFLADLALASVDAVYDRGDPFDPSDWSLDPSGQQLLLEATPVGPVTADASTIGAGMTPATLAQMMTDMLGRGGIGAWSLADAQAIDTATGYAGTGYYAGDVQSVRQGLTSLLPSYGAGFWQDGAGNVRVARVVDPDTVADVDLAFDLTGDDLVEDLQCIPDEAPNLTRRMAYRPNAYVHGAGDLVTDLADVPPQRRIELTSACRGIAYSGAALADRYRHADTAPPLVSCFWDGADAQAEIDRICALYAVPRFFYTAPVVDPALAPQPGQVGRLTYPQHGLEAGRKLLVVDVSNNRVSGALTMTLWGA